MKNDYYLVTLAEHGKGNIKKAAMCLSVSLGIAHEIPTIDCCTSEGMWEKPVIHLSASKIHMHTYIPTYVSPQKLVTCISVTLCHRCISLFRQNDKEI